MNFRILFILLLLAVGGCRRSAPAENPSSGPRIVSLAPNLTEMVCAVGAGASLVGRTSACDFPAEAASVPEVGGYGDPSFELLLSLQPTHILYVDMLNKDIPVRLAERGLRACHIPCLHLNDIPAALEAIGNLTDRREQGAALARQLRADIEEARVAVSKNTGPKVFVALWADPLYTVGRGSFVSELVALAGGRNIGDEIESAYFQASPEWVIGQNPDIILCLFSGEAVQTAGRFYGLPAFASLSAIRHRRVYGGFDLDELLRPGPRVMRSVKALRRCFTNQPLEKSDAP
ncbi:MAG: helical backbone metal receptor [Kiritimatiellia bacterium]